MFFVLFFFKKVLFLRFGRTNEVSALMKKYFLITFLIFNQKVFYTDIKVCSDGEEAGDTQ